MANFDMWHTIVLEESTVEICVIMLIGCLIEVAKIFKSADREIRDGVMGVRVEGDAILLLLGLVLRIEH